MEEINGQPVNAEESEIRDILAGFKEVFSQKKEIMALTRYQNLPKFQKPDGLIEQMETLRGYYKKDPLFGALIDAISVHAISGPDWEYVDEESEMKIIKGEAVETKTSDIERMWRYWDERLNLKVGNLLPGTEEVDKWIINDLLLGGVSAIAWDWDKMEISNDARYKDRLFPVVMINHPIESVRLEKSGKSWTTYKENILIKKREDTKSGVEGVPEADKEGADITKEDYKRLIPMWQMDKKSGSFCLKYRWSPGMVKIKDEDQSIETEMNLFPSPPFENCIPWLMQREALCSSDIQILDGLINYILAWVIGDKDMKQPLRGQKTDKDGKVIRKSDFAIMKEMIEEYGAKKVLEIFLPWFIKPEFVTPPTDTVMSREKYVEATAEILYRFGILSPSSTETQIENFDSIGFEGIILDFRKHISQFWNLLNMEIATRNELTASPKRKYSPLPFSRKEILSSIQKGHQSGEISTETMNRLLGVDPRVERSRVFKEVLRGDRTVYEKAVPVQFSQTVAKDGQKETKNTSKEPNRPEGVEEEDNRKLANGN